MIFGYSRNSKSDDQSVRLQLQAFKNANVEKIFHETASGGRWNRPVLHKMLDQLREGDIIIVWKLDRLSRSLKDLLIIMERIDQARAGFKSLTEAIDTTTSAGRMMMQMVGSFAEFEREMIRERTKAGLEAAKAEGRIGGRKQKLKEDQRKDIIENILSDRKTAAQMARLYDVSEATISRVMAKNRQHII
jgi:DNA invertase Pin-like site-specific DNA recombinase